METTNGVDSKGTTIESSVEDDDAAVDSTTPSSDTILTLTAMNGAAISQACRAAAMEMINESRNWGKAELSMWLSGPYAFVTSHASKEASAPVWPVPLLREIDVRLIDRIMLSARTEILETLSAIARDTSASFVLRALISGTVVRCEDAEGHPAWAPTGGATRLADRVLSLFAVDYLARPGDYETELFVCPMCESVSFDANARKSGMCANHGRNQSLSAPRGRNTLPYPPLGA